MRGGIKRRYPAYHWLDEVWPFIIVMAAAICSILIHGVTYTSGVFYVEFLEEFNQGRGLTAWVGSLIGACGYAASPVSSILVNKFGCRFTVILSGVIIATGLCTSVFAQNVYVLFFTYGVVTGVGCGLIYVPAKVIVAIYFTKRRTIALGVASSCGGLGSFAFPPLLRYLLDEFGWRGTLLICGGLCLNVCVAGALMRPPPVEYTETLEEKNTSEVKSKVVKADEDKRKDLMICKNTSYNFICINNTLFCFASSIVYVHLAAFATGKLGISESDSTNLISVVGIATFIGRLSFGFLAQHPKLKPIYLYSFFFLAAGLATITVPLMTNYYQIVAFSAFFGLSFAALGGALLPCILIDIAGLDKLSISYGVLIFYEAVGQILGAPVAGFLYDSYKTYDPSFYLGGTMVLLSVVVLALPIKKTCSNKMVKYDSDEIVSSSLLDVKGDKAEVVIVPSKASKV